MTGELNTRRFVRGLAVLFLALPSSALALDPPEELALRVYAKPAGKHLYLLLRVPFKVLNGVNFPSRGEKGELDLAGVDAVLSSAARWWIADNIELYEGDALLPKPEVAETRVSLPSNDSFASYEEAWEHVTGSRLPGHTQIFRDQAMLDVLLDYPIRSDQASFAIHSLLDRLGARVSTDLRFLPPGGQPNDGIRVFEYEGDPGLFRLDPRWCQSARRFVSLGFFEILKGTDYLLFLFGAALLFRERPAALVPFVASFIIAYSVTLIASAYNLATDALWFPVLIDTLIAISIVFLAFLNIVTAWRATPGAGEIYNGKNRWPFAFGFGLVYGFGFYFTLRPALQFAGSHVLVSVLSFNAGVKLGLIIVLVLMISALGILFRFTSARRATRQMELVIISALVADLGWHRVTDRADRLSQFNFQWPVWDASLLASAMLWVTIFLVVGGLGCLVFAMLRNRAAGVAPTGKPTAGDDTDVTLSSTGRSNAR